jgi:hypothetical protein
VRVKHADGLKATFTALVHEMQTDTRFTVDEKAALTAINVIQDANGATTIAQDMVVVQCLKKFCTQSLNYT